MDRSTKTRVRSRLGRRPGLESLEVRLALSTMAVPVAPLPPLPTSGVLNGFVFKLVSQSGTPAPGAEGGTLTNTYIQPSRVADNAQVVFAQTVNDANGVPAGEGLFVTKFGPKSAGKTLRQPRPPITQIVRSGEAVLGGTLGSAGTLGTSSINNRGDVAFAASLNGPAPLTNGAPGGIYRFKRARRQLEAIALPGDLLPDGGTFQGANSRVSQNNGGSVAFAAVSIPTTPNVGLAGANFGSGVYIAGALKRVNKIAAPGDVTPEGTVLDYVSDPSLSDIGNVAYIGHSQGESTLGLVDPAGTFVVNGQSVDTRLMGGSLYFVRPNNDPSVLVRQGQPLTANQGGGTLLYAADPVTTNTGATLFLGALQGTNGGLNGTPSLAIYRFTSAQGITRIAGPGDALPDGSLFVSATSESGSIDINDRGDITFLATTTSGQGIYINRNDTLSVVARTGDVIPALGLGSITSFTQGNSRTPGPQINTNQQIVFSANTSTGTDALFVASSSRAISKRAKI